MANKAGASESPIVAELLPQHGAETHSCYRFRTLTEIGSSTQILTNNDPVPRRTTQTATMQIRPSICNSKYDMNLRIQKLKKTSGNLFKEHLHG